MLGRLGPFLGAHWGLLRASSRKASATLCRRNGILEEKRRQWSRIGNSMPLATCPASTGLVTTLSACLALCVLTPALAATFPTVELASIALISRLVGEGDFSFTELPFFATGFPSAALPISCVSAFFCCPSFRKNGANSAANIARWPSSKCRRWMLDYQPGIRTYTDKARNQDSVHTASGKC
jgi:hypothetical protein